jgi:hypothetical protein
MRNAVVRNSSTLPGKTFQLRESAIQVELHFQVLFKQQ